jgi:hypothetical protein
MGMPMRQGRHAKQKQWKRVRLRGPNSAGRDEPGLVAGTQPQASVQVQPGRQAPAGTEASAARPGPAAAQTPAGQAPARQEPAGQAPPRRGAAEAQPPVRQGPAAKSMVAAPSAPSELSGLSAAARAEQLVSDALQAQVDGRHEELARCAAQLAERRGTGRRDWQKAVERELLASLIRAITAGWRQGWQPAEVVREIGRQFGARHARMATDAAAMEMRNYNTAAVDERWQAQLTALGATAWWNSDDGYLEQWREREQAGIEVTVTCALEVLFGFATLPRLGRVCPLPGTARQGVASAQQAVAGPAGERTLGRAKALLAEAESTEFPGEAETLSARAQGLLAARSIDEAVLAAGTGPGRLTAAGRRLFVDGPYEVAKTDLLDAVAMVNRCRAVWHRNLGLSTVLGFPGDLDAVELLFASLLEQAGTAMVREGSRRDDVGPSRVRSFRQAFLATYAQRIGERLADAAGAAERKAVSASSGSDLLPVLAARHRVVDEAVGKMFPELARHGVGAERDRQGWLPGLAAAYVA